MTQDDGRAKGRIKGDWYVWCGECGDHEHLDWIDARRAGSRAALARAKGWILTRDQGWVCPSCLARRNADA
jgi:hypothetical protein